MKTKLFTLIVCFLLCASALRADYLLGGHITYVNIGEDSFMVRLTLYRDCNKSEMKDANLEVRCKSSGELITTMHIKKPNGRDVTPLCCTGQRSRCHDRKSPFPFGFEEYTFMGLLVLPNNLPCCEILISFSDCCHSTDLINIETFSQFYLETMLNRCLYPQHSTVRFYSIPVFFNCVYRDHRYIHGLTDNDLDTTGGFRDFLHFEFTPPLVAPGNPVKFTPSFTYDKPVYFYGFPEKDMALPQGIHLDSKTGTLEFRAMQVDQASFAIKISQKRKIATEIVSVNEITMQMSSYSIMCPNNKAPELSGPFYTEVYAGDSISFRIYSYDQDINDTVKIHYSSKEIPNAVWTDNSGMVKNPSGTFTWHTRKEDARSVPYSFYVKAQDDSWPSHGRSHQEYQILVWDSLTIGINNSNLPMIKIYPNPANNQLTIESSQAMDKIILYNFLGAKIREVDVNENKATLNRDKLPSGLYLLKVYDEKGDVYVYQVVFK